MSSLHTLNKSPTGAPLLQRCLRLAQPGSAIVLIEDAVYAAVEGTVSADLLRDASTRFAIYALSPDLMARGLAGKTLIDGIMAIDDAGFVELVVEHERVISWY